ncbi:MAG: HAD hydrolase family protein [Bacteroidia bacterium]
MGKPFKKEIEESYSTVNWALDQDTSLIQDRIFKNVTKPLFIVGSGGSLSACHFAASVYQNLGCIAKAITPLELYYARFSLKNSKVLFISSSGRNNDILFAFKVALQNHADSITTICMRKDAPLTKLANSYSVSEGFEFDIPTRKDGFLATNSLTAFFTILGKAAGVVDSDNQKWKIKDDFKKDISNFVQMLKFDSTVTVLYGGWSTAIAYDFESKFTEAALGSVLLADYRNFGHGRHHWFAKRKENSAIIALVTPEEKQIAEKTLGLIPSNIPRLFLSSEKSGANCSIDLLVKAYHVVNAVGENIKIDPGRPGVPAFGSKLYHLRYSSFYKQFSSLNLTAEEEQSILKKANKSSVNLLDSSEIEFWRNKYLNFKKKLSAISYSTIVFDYDGTLCSQKERYTGISKEISDALVKLLKAGIIIGVATGRGASVRKDLRTAIPKKFWKNIIVGYYNGADVSSLNDETCPNTDLKPNQKLTFIESEIKKLSLPWSNIEMKLRPHQLTIETTDHTNWETIRKIVQNFAVTHSGGELQLLESSHSIDLVVGKKATKMNVVNYCLEHSKKSNKINNCLTIGDKGQWPGNDFELLATPYSLSVDEVSSHPDTCWNLSAVGYSSSMATLSYLSKIQLKESCFKIVL